MITYPFDIGHASPQVPRDPSLHPATATTPACLTPRDKADLIKARDHGLNFLMVLLEIWPFLLLILLASTGIKLSRRYARVKA